MNRLNKAQQDDKREPVFLPVATTSIFARLLPKAKATIVPVESGAGRSLALVIAIMAFLTSCTLAGVFMISRTTADWRATVSRELTIQVRPLTQIDLAAETQKAAEIARGTPGITEATIISRTEAARLLEPWLGAGEAIKDLPIPNLIALTVNPSSPPNISILEKNLKERVRGASLDDHSVWRARLATMANTLTGIGLLMFGLMVAATALTVVFATRGVMSGNKDVIDVLHAIGAEERFIAQEFERRFLVLGLKGALWGGAASVVLFGSLTAIITYWIPDASRDQLNALFGQLNLGYTGYGGLLGCISLIAVVTALTSRITVHRYLHETT